MIERADISHIPAIVELHQRVLGHTLNARIGDWFLRRLYRGVILSSANGICYVYRDGSAVIGFLSACRDHHQLERALRGGLSKRDGIRAALCLAKHPLWWGMVLRQILFSRYLSRRFSGVYPTILTLGVAPEAQGKGIASALIERALHDSIAEGGDQMYVDTEASNTRAIQMYHRNGFRDIEKKYGNIILHYGTTRNSR